MATQKLYVFKNTDKDHENQPDMRICIKDGNDDLMDVGALWKEESPQGNTYLSGKMSDGYKDREAHWIMSETEKKYAKAYEREMDVEEDDDDGLDYPDDEDITPEDIPF